jgi:assimilatory nitrate reductase catalytic subunit
MDERRHPVAAATHCPYCAMQCGMHVDRHDGAFSIAGNSEFPVNKGGLCVKGWSAGDTLNHPDRLLTPLMRNATGALVPATWDAALDYVARGLRAVRARHGADAVGVFGSGSLTNEKAYLLGKFARVAVGTANIDYNGRFCMSSAAAAATQAFGIDRGLPFPLEDIQHANTVLLAGSNVAETMPPLMQYFAAFKANGGKLLVADPRHSATAQWASTHLRLRPGSDIALAHGLLHILIRDRLIDTAFIADRTEGFDDVRELAAAYWPERVERLTGIPEADLNEAARTLGTAKRAIVLTGRGPEQQSQGVNNALAYINLALALGQVGKRFGGYGALTGQGNGQGGREHGQKADQLPGYRKITDPQARRHVAQVWGVPESSLPGPGKSAFELLNSLGPDGGVRALLVIGSNVLVSAPDASRVRARLQSLDLLVVSDFFLSETAELAHVVLPSAQWAEEDGTTTNLEGRVVRRRRALEPPPDVRTDLEVLVSLAGRLGRKHCFPSARPQDVFDELRAASRGGIADYSGITYQRIDAENGVFWPCPDERHPGTPRLFADGFPTASGRARFHAVRHRKPAEDRDEDYPLYLTTGRVLAQYQSGTQTRRVAALQSIAPEPIAQVHPLTARRLGLRDAAPAALTTRRGTAVFTVKLTPAIREDTVFVPFHWGGDQSINRLTNPALDPGSRMPEFKICAVRVAPVAADVLPRGTRAPGGAQLLPIGERRTVPVGSGSRVPALAQEGGEP